MYISMTTSKQNRYNDHIKVIYYCLQYARVCSGIRELIEKWLFFKLTLIIIVNEYIHKLHILFRLLYEHLILIHVGI